jgi:hypothetical protein
MSMVLRILRRATVRTGIAIARRRWAIAATAVGIVALILGSTLNLISLPTIDVDASSQGMESRAPNEPESTAMFFEGHKRFDARLIWNAYSPTYAQARQRAGDSPDEMQRQLETTRRSGAHIEASYVASYPIQNGKMAFYAVTKVGTRRGEVETIPYAFKLDADGKIIAVY